MNEVQSGIAEIKTAMITKGYTLGEISTETIDYAYKPMKIKELFNTTELNTQKIDNAADWLNPFSAIFEWQRQNGMLLGPVKRWFDWLEYNQQIVRNKVQKHQYLMTREGDQTEQLCDINGDPIISLEGYFSK